MRFFRIPNFTGIESHRDDADRGTLRLAEGCIPSGPGGLRSGPVWQDLGTVTECSADNSNWLSGANDGKGNSMLFASRDGVIHDVKCFPADNTDIVSLGASYQVAVPGVMADVTQFQSEKAYLSTVGNRKIGWGDGSAEAMFGGEDSSSYLNTDTYPENAIYKMEYSWFPKCRFFVVGPNKCIFASGNPSSPLTVYISEPAGLTVSDRDSPFSTETSVTGSNPGALSTVDILMSNASKITALSNRGNQVIVHTDAGAFLLYAPAPDQAEDGYRVAQAPSTVTSAAVNQSVTGGEDGTQPYYLGHDGQIYKDQAVSRGSEETDRYSDPDQASWKAKGRWEDEHPTDLSKSFSAYEPEVGQYWLFLENEDYAAWAARTPPSAPTGLTAGQVPSAPTVLSAVLDLTSVAPSTPTAFTGALDLTSIAPSTPHSLTASSELQLPSAPTGFGASWTLAFPSTPMNFGAAVDLSSLLPAAPTSFEALEIVTVPSAPVNLTAHWSLAKPSAPTLFGASWTLAHPSAPTGFGAVLDLTSVVPSAPTGFTGVLDLASYPPHAPTLFTPSWTLAHPSTPTGFGAVLDPATIAPAAPTNFGGADSCNLLSPCAGYYGGGAWPYAASVTATIHGWGASTGYYQGSIPQVSNSVIPHDNGFGHPNYLGSASFVSTHSWSSGMVGDIPVRIFPPERNNSRTELLIGVRFPQPWSPVKQIRYYKYWANDGPCSTGRCWAAGTYLPESSTWAASSVVIS